MASRGITFFDGDTDATVKWVARRTCKKALLVTATNGSGSPSWARQFPYQEYPIGGVLYPSDQSDLYWEFQQGTYHATYGVGLSFSDSAFSFDALLALGDCADILPSDVTHTTFQPGESGHPVLSLPLLGIIDTDCKGDPGAGQLRFGPDPGHASCTVTWLYTGHHVFAGKFHTDALGTPQAVEVDQDNSWPHGGMVILTIHDPVTFCDDPIEGAPDPGGCSGAALTLY